MRSNPSPAQTAQRRRAWLLRLIAGVVGGFGVYENADLSPEDRADFRSEEHTSELQSH